ncbi:hypothetical protein V8C86DRAFT_2894035 [Haematococcus lacustris]
MSGPSLPQLPLHQTPEFPNGTRGHFHVVSEYNSWDFLRGAGPSAQERYHDPLEKKGFKPGWQSMRRAADIKQDAERVQSQAAQGARQEAALQARSQRALTRQLDHGFNPITGQEFNKETHSWQPANNPWSHARPCLRPGAKIAALQHQSGGPELAVLRPGGGAASAPPAQRVEALARVGQQRQTRIVAEGLTASAAKRPAGGMKDILQWS